MTSYKKLNKINIKINGTNFKAYNASYIQLAELLGKDDAGLYYSDIERAAIKTNNIDTRLRFILREWDQVNFDLTKKMDYFSEAINKFIRISKELTSYTKTQKLMLNHIIKERQKYINSISGIFISSNDNVKPVWSDVGY